MTYTAAFARRHAGRLLTSLLVLLLAAPVLAQAPPPSVPWHVSPQLTESERLAAFDHRRDSLVAMLANQVPATDLTQGGYWNIAADLYLGQNLGWAAARLDALASQRPSGDMFWMYPVTSVMCLDRGQLPADTRAKVRDLWRTYMPYRGDTENHWAMYYASLYLVAELYPDDGPETWFNGKSSRENMDEAKDYLRHWMELTTTIGQGEYDSPGYMSFYVAPMAMLAGFAQDAEVQQRGRMMLEYLLADFYAETLDGVHVGGSSRIYPNPLLNRSLENGSAHAWLLFGNTPYALRGEAFLVGVSGFVPSRVLHGIATDRSTPYLEREFKRTRHRIRGAALGVTQRNAPIYKQTYVAPEYAVGSTQGGAEGGTLQPIQQHTWEVAWRLPDPRVGQNLIFTHHPYDQPEEGAMYFAEPYEMVNELIMRSKTEYTRSEKWTGGSPYEQIAQADDAVIALYDIPASDSVDAVSGFFGATLADRVEDASGWIFARGGDALVAYRPLAPYSWRSAENGASRLYSPHRKNGAVVQVAPASAYASFDAFKAAVRALPLVAAMNGTPRVQFTTLRGAAMDVTYGQTPRINGQAVDYANWPLYDSPFLRANRGSQRLEMRYGNTVRTLDFATLTVTDAVVE